METKITQLIQSNHRKEKMKPEKEPRSHNPQDDRFRCNCIDKPCPQLNLTKIVQRRLDVLLKEIPPPHPMYENEVKIDYWPKHKTKSTRILQEKNWHQIFETLV